MKTFLKLKNFEDEYLQILYVPLLLKDSGYEN